MAIAREHKLLVIEIAAQARGAEYKGRRAGLQQKLNAQEIQSGIHYPLPVHVQKAHADLGYKQGDFPLTAQVADEILSLPMCTELTDDEIRQVVEVNQAF